MLHKIKSMQITNHDSEQGVALVEFALTATFLLPFLLLIIFVAILLARSFALQYSLGLGVRNGIVSYYKDNLTDNNPISEIRSSVINSANAYGFNLSNTDMVICALGSAACISCGVLSNSCSDEIIETEKNFVVAVNGGQDLFSRFIGVNYSTAVLGVNSKPLKMRAF